MSALRLGIVGCGVISTRYLTNAALFPDIEIVACADLDEETARTQAEGFGVRHTTVDTLLGADDVDLVVNLTPPDAHYDVSLGALSAGKHVYTEKPLADSTERARRLLDEARARDLHVGCAPDTFLGAAGQTVRALVDGGRIGRVTGGTCHVMGRGPEAWHPNPDFFFQPGGGPVLDMGPYYVTYLVNVVGPVRKVAAMAGSAFAERTIGSGPRAGETVPVATPTTVHAVLEFESGAVVSLGASFDVWRHGHANIEIYGSEGSLLVPDPNFFDGDPRVSTQGKDFEPVSSEASPFAVPNRELSGGARRACYRVLGVADLAAALRAGRAHRCAGELGLHVVEVLESILRAAESGRIEDVHSRCERPAALATDEARALLEGTA